MANNVEEYDYTKSDQVIQAAWTRGLTIGCDPIGTVYSIVSRDYESTLGGLFLKDKGPETIGYKIVKGAGMLGGLAMNYFLCGAPQAITGMIDALTAIKDRREHKKSIEEVLESDKPSPFDSFSSS